jgi:hypothetical protein
MWMADTNVKREVNVIWRDYIVLTLQVAAGVAQSVQRLATSCTVPGTDLGTAKRYPFAKSY